MQRLFLIGLAGSGKSTVGKLVASLLGWLFIDTDELLAERTGLPAWQVLTDYGEEYFRELECETLQLAAMYERVVIATGGGCVIADANRQLLREQGLTVYLQTTVEIAWQRIQKQKRGKRPLVSGADGRQRLSDQLARRQAWYEEACVHVDADVATPLHVARQILVRALTHGCLREPDLVPISSMLDSTITLSQAMVEWGGLSRLPEAFQVFNIQRRVFVVTDTVVGSLYAEALQSLLVQADLTPYIFTVPSGEPSKSFAFFQQILHWLVEQRTERTEPLIALGGGVVGDLTGFVASCYRRGIPFIQIPTTLLAQVDSAIGGKTGINHPLGKNVIGTFYQPELIVVDPAVLLTLSGRVYREGWAEIVKYGVVLDEELFALLEGHLPELAQRDPGLLTEVVARCIRMKMDVVQHDERDVGLRNLLNYGHTFGHALETVTEYGTWLHGEAVSIGMEVAGRIAVARGMISQGDLERQRRLLRAIGLPVECPGVDGEAILMAMQNDKKVQAGRTRWILPERIGQAQMCGDVSVEMVRDAIAAVCHREGVRL